MTSSKFINFSQQDLRAFCINTFLAMGSNLENAELAADVLIEADLRGIDSHGVARLSGYVRLWENGRINMNPNVQLIKSKLAAGTVDGDQGLGLVVGPKAMNMAIEKAQNTGCGFITVTNSNHFGIAGYHALMAAQKKCIGMAMTNASPLVAPTNSSERLLGTNPICYAIPAGKYPPFVADLATSAAANGKLEIAERNNKMLPLGWLQNKAGFDTQNPTDLKGGGALLPLGSNKDLGSHKGFALSAVVDILCGVLSGANYGPWVPPFVSFLPLAENMPGKGLGHFLGALHIDAFRDYAEFEQNMDQWIERFKQSTPVDSLHPVIIPGEPEHEFKLERTEKGIPLIAQVVTDLEQTAKKLGINL